MKKTLLVVILILLLPFCALAKGFGRGGFGGGQPPEPRLVRPTSEMVDLRGKDNLEFKWWSNVGGYAGNQYFDFRLYKGYQMFEQTLIMKEQLPPHANNIIVNSNVFEDGQVYTWSLRNVYGAEKSDRVHVSFKVIKK